MISVNLLLIVKQPGGEIQLTRTVELPFQPLIGDGIDLPPCGMEGFMFIVDARYFDRDGRLWVYDDQSTWPEPIDVKSWWASGWEIHNEKRRRPKNRLNGKH